MSKRFEISNLIRTYSKIWSYQLYLEWKYREKNVSNAFKGVGAFGELISSFYKDGYIGTGSGGSGFDLINNKLNKEVEVKTSVTFQSNKCSDCEYKFSKLFNDCTNCGSQNFKIVDDSRFGINAKTLLNAYEERIIDSLLCYHIFELPDSIDIENGDIEFIINCYSIPFEYQDSLKERKRLAYFQNQLFLSSKSNNCNLLPLSYDFWLLSPNFFDSWKVKINFQNPGLEPIVENIWNEELSKILLNIDICKNREERQLFEKVSYGEETIPLDVFVENFDYREKNFDRDRGQIKSLLANKKRR
ncbi:hypothetical protein U5U50_02825 [Mycoplasma sp. 888]|uniref:hypothetical protein n=1 Tax=Mycoplasma sp. 888 TaxID=3108483 RepID=UPI002D77449E|nr:hypothetical protein [Mycoplasma sp. 888]WRQ25713.1 hypothetical protein U5U50_02825 [Mycoplasma sp. 888]